MRINMVWFLIYKKIEKNYVADPINWLGFTNHTLIKWDQGLVKQSYSTLN